MQYIEYYTLRSTGEGAWGAPAKLGSDLYPAIYSGGLRPRPSECVTMYSFWFGADAEKEG